jgi:hypothetical protein
MAGRSSSHGRRRVIAAAFAAQAAGLAVIAAASCGSSAVHQPGEPPRPVPPATAGRLVPAVSPSPSLRVPAGMIGVTVAAAQPGGGTQSGDITFPAPEDPPRFVLKPGADITITVRLVIPAGEPARGLWAGMAPGQWTGGPVRLQRRLLTFARPLGPGQYSFTLHWSLPAGTRAGDGNLLVLGVARSGATQVAPVAELAAS